MYDHFAHYYNRIFPFDDDLKTFLVPYIKPEERAIDLGCGTGRLVHLLNTFKMNVVGVDLNENMIQQAKIDFPNLNFYQGNMVDFLIHQPPLSLMTCFGNTIPHLHPDELMLFFKRIKQVLSPNGYLLIQLLNYNNILKKRPHALKPIDFERGSFIREYEYHHDYILFKTILTIDDMKTSDQTKLYPYTKNELIDIIERHHLHVQAYRDFDQSSWQEDGDLLSMVITHAHHVG